MPRRRSSLATKTSRLALPLSDAPEWEVVSPGVRLGYRRGRGTLGKGGNWLAAARDIAGKRLQQRLGHADDVADADGAQVLTHEQAKDAARSWATSLLRAGGKPTYRITVNDALDQYLAAREAEGMKSIDDTRRRANHHIRPVLGKFAVADLTVAQLSRWRDGIANSPKQLRTGRFAEKRNTAVTDLNDPEVKRRRRDTANRNLTILKAALNWAHQHQLVQDDTAWRLTKPYQGTTAARVRFLAADEQTRLLGKCEGALKNLTGSALVTGARFGELRRLDVQDFDEDNGSIFVAESKSGKSRHVPLPPGGVRLFAKLAKDRPGNAPLLVNDDGERWTTSSYSRDFRAAVAAANLEAITFHEIRHTYASTMVRAGAMLSIVAQALGHSDTRMVEKHYGHLAPSYVADTIRKHAPDLQIDF